MNIKEFLDTLDEQLRYLKERNGWCSMERVYATIDLPKDKRERLLASAQVSIPDEWLTEAGQEGVAAQRAGALTEVAAIVTKAAQDAVSDEQISASEANEVLDALDLPTLDVTTGYHVYIEYEANAHTSAPMDAAAKEALEAKISAAMKAVLVAEGLTFDYEQECDVDAETKTTDYLVPQPTES